MPTFNPYDRKHLQNVACYQRMIEEIYAQAAKEAAQIAASLRGVDTETPFHFEDYPQTRKRVDALLRSLQSQIQVTVVNGINSEWTLANNKNNELANRVFGDNVGRLSQSAYRRYYSTNDNARQAFQQRKINGLSLSDRVWRYTDQFKEEIELGLDVGIRSGLSADQMTRDLKQYLRHPDKLFRRVRDERGQLHLSKAAAAFHPGRGVYRSSYMNARRLAGTETNIAYRTSDYTRWQQMDFVVGIEVRLSPTNHTCVGKDGKPHPFEDICDELAGRYPKEFKFTGWHPHCRCHAVSILKTQKEIAEDTKKILKGETPDSTSVNEVKDVPPQFKRWLEANKDRLKAAQARGTLPYFIRDNGNIVTRVLDGDIVIPQPMDAVPEPIAIPQEQGSPIPNDSIVPIETDTQKIFYVEKVEELELRKPKVKAEPIVEEYIETDNPYDSKFKAVHEAIEHWREGMDIDPKLLQLIENSEFHGELYRGISMTEAEYQNFRKALDKNAKDATLVLNQDREVISWSKGDPKALLEFYAAGGENYPRRVLLHMKEATVRAYDNDRWLEMGNSDKEVMLTKNTKFEFVRVQKRYDERGEYFEVYVKAKNESSLKTKQVEREFEGELNLSNISKINGELSYEKGGAIKADKFRMEKAATNKQETQKFEKELNMADMYARQGHKVELVKEKTGVPTPDAIIDGKKVDFKSLSSANNIIRHAKEAIRKQGADEVWFEFTTKNSEITKEIQNLTRMGIHGKYYFRGEGTVYNF